MDQVARLLIPSTCIGMRVASILFYNTPKTSTGDAATLHIRGRQNEHPGSFQFMSWHLATAFDFLWQPCFTLFNQHVSSAPKKITGQCGSYPNISSSNSSFSSSTCSSCVPCLYVRHPDRHCTSPSSTASTAEAEEAETRATKKSSPGGGVQN